MGERREISAFGNDARIRFLYPLFRDAAADDIMLLRTDRGSRGTCTSTRKGSACLRMKLYFDHIWLRGGLYVLFRTKRKNCEVRLLRDSGIWTGRHEIVPSLDFFIVAIEILRLPCYTIA